MPVTSKSTKIEILKAYNDLLQEKEQLEARVQQLIKEKQAAVKGVSKTPEKARVAEPPAAPSTLDQIIATLSVLQPGFGDAVSELSSKLIAEASKLSELRRSVREEMQQLETLHGLEVTDDTLDQVIQEYTEKSTTFESEAKERQETFEQEMTEKRKGWHKEQEEHARFVKERDETTRKTEQREAAEYKYDLELQRKLGKDQYGQQQEQLKKALTDFEDAKQREWAVREKQLAEQEKEFAELQARVEKFPKELEAAVKKAKEGASAITRRQIKVKADLRAKEAEGDRRVYELKTQSLEEAIKQQQQQISSLSTQLDSAVKQAKDMAVKAIEGASNVSSLKAVREIALEQAKTVQKGQ